MTGRSSISIVTPSYNQGRFIERTIRSVTGQGYPRLEYILMDGGSTDETMRIVERYRAELSYIVSAADAGQADALASGFGRSSGDIMAWLNSDDMLAPGTLDFVDAFFRENPEVDAIYSHRLTVDENDRVKWYWLLPPHSSRLMEIRDFIPQETCFWRRSLYDRSGGLDRSLQFAMDYDLFLRFMETGRFARVNAFLGAFREHPDAKTSLKMATVGRSEVDLIRLRRGLSRGVLNTIAGIVSSRAIRLAGWAHEKSGRTLHGSLAGTGYDYNELWNGRLRDGPAERA